MAKSCNQKGKILYLQKMLSETTSQNPVTMQEILAKLEGTYDFIFMDAAKGQYIHFLPDVMRLLKVGGILISDNVLQDGDIIESHYAVERRNRTIYKRMREYLYELKHDEHLMTSIVPIGDGATLSVKIKE